MPIQINLEDIRNAWEFKDPQLPILIKQLSEQPDKKEQNVRKNAPTFDSFLFEINSRDFQRKSMEKKALFRMEQIKRLESMDAEVPLSDRLRLYEIILALWQEDTRFSRRTLLDVIATVQLTYGPWKALKRIYKEAEAKEDTEIIGALAARFDMAFSNRRHKISQKTLGYMCRRGWRYLRRVAESLPIFYAEAASDYLVRYTDHTQWEETWIANHIFFHETGAYQRQNFNLRAYRRGGRKKSYTKDRAYSELWRRTPRPLFALLEQARCEEVRKFAVESLKKDFRAALREVEPVWVARIIQVNSPIIDEFAVWVLNNSPKLEQAMFRKMGLHAPVLKLFESGADSARVYAAEYARTYARDLPLTDIIQLIRNTHATVRKLAFDLLTALNPRKDVGLSAWGEILDTQYGHEHAAQALRKHFGARDLTPDWFKNRMLSSNAKTSAFAVELLPQVHPFKKLGTAFFIELMEALFGKYSERNRSRFSKIAGFLMDRISEFDLNELEKEFLKKMFLHPLGVRTITTWVENGRLNPQALDISFYKSLAYHPDWEVNPWIAQLKAASKQWAEVISFNEVLSEQILNWFTDIRKFKPENIGFQWLMSLVERSESKYHQFAVDMLVRNFSPADFAEPEATVDTEASTEDVNVDLNQQSFLFTGKMAALSRKNAQKQVLEANGKNASGVTAALNFLVIGDDGSPLYGGGRKGSKQLKAEKMNAAGSDIKIISESAFSKMLTGRETTSSAKDVLAGCRRIWDMAVSEGKEDDAGRRFALEYLRRRHPDICLAETDRPVDPGMEIPASFLTFKQVKPLFSDSRKPVRDLALDYARWEFARWSPAAEDLVELCELPDARIKLFVSQALLAEDIQPNRRFRLNPEVMTPAAVYDFCESANAATRDLGMALIRRYPQFQLPDELFRLTESPDRRLRAFVIRSIWSLYRRTGITSKRQPPPAKDTGKPPVYSQKSRMTLAEKPLAGHEDLHNFLRRILFEIPPARYEKREENEHLPRLKPLPARKAKLAVIEVMRDFAVENREFADVIGPLLEEFMHSKGKSEMAACLVAITRIERAHNGSKS